MQIGKIVFILLIIYPLQLFAADAGYIARVSFKRGDVTALDGHTKKTRKLLINSPIYENDTINVGKRGLAQLVFADQTMMYIKANSSVELSKYQFNKKRSSGSSFTNLLKGGMRAITGVIGKKQPKKVKYKNKVATIGIRGTAIELLENSVRFDFGKGVMKTANQTVVLNEGEGAKASSQNLLSPNPKYGIEKYFKLRKDTDASVIARVLIESYTDQIPGAIGRLCRVLPLEEAALLMGMESQVNSFSGEDVLATMSGFKSCFNKDELSILLTSAVLMYPALGPALFQVMITGDNALDTDSALNAVLKGLIKPSEELLNKVIGVAVLDGKLDKKGAEKVLVNLQSLGYCAL